MKISVRMIFISNVRLRITKTLMPYSLMCTMTIEIHGIFTDTSAMIMSLLVSKIYFIYCGEFLKINQNHWNLKTISLTFIPISYKSGILLAVFL